MGERCKKSKRLSTVGADTLVRALALARWAVLGLLLERDFDRDVTPEETTGDIAGVTLLDAGLNFGNASRQRVALGEAEPNNTGKDRDEQQLGHHL